MFFGGGGDPFEHFHHGGMGGGGRGGRGGRGGGPASKDVDTTKLYESLGLEKSAGEKEIKKAYRKAAIQHHPDKGGDEAKFKEISAAYEILSDPEKRVRYDKYGLDGVSDEGGSGRSPDDIFSMFFGGRDGGRPSAPRKGENVNHPIKLSLEDLYNGKTVKLAINRQKIIGEARSCSSCDGQGVVVELRQIALGMVQQVQRRCTACSGEGYVCKTEKERKILEVNVDKGMKNGEKVVFFGMADEKPNMEAGDINFIVQEKEHDTFKRKGADLLISKTLSLNEALCGFEWSLEHLDDRTIIIKSRPGEVIKPETFGGQPFVKVVSGEGMPSRGNPFVKGNLYVLFSVEFPSDNELDLVTVKALKEVLPNPSIAVDYDENEDDVVHLDGADVKSFGKGGAPVSNDAYESDDEANPQNVQCQQS